MQMLVARRLWRRLLGRPIPMRGTTYWQNPAGFEWRNGLIFKARRKGRTVASIAKQHGISGPRVSQIIKDYERNHGG